MGEIIKEAYRENNFPLFIGKITWFFFSPSVFSHDPTHTHYPPPSSSGCCAGTVVLIVDAITGWWQLCWKRSLSDINSKNKEEKKEKKLG